MTKRLYTFKETMVAAGLKSQRGLYLIQDRLGIKPRKVKTGVRRQEVRYTDEMVQQIVDARAAKA